MKFQTCKCGCNVFKTVRPTQYDSDEFFVDSRSKDIRSEVNGIPIAQCLECDRYIIPSTSMAGISVLDPRVATYREVLRAVEAHNNRIQNIAAFGSYIIELEKKVADLESKLIAVAGVSVPVDEVKVINMITGEVQEVVKTAKGSRKKPESDIS